MKNFALTNGDMPYVGIGKCKITQDLFRMRRMLYHACHDTTIGSRFMHASIVIIGTGLAGYQLAREFRKLDTTTPLLLLTTSDGRFYPKPQLSVALTSGKNSSTLATATAETMASQLNATILTNTAVTAIHPESKTISTKNDTITYEKLILACGANTISPALTGDAAETVISINHLEDYAVFEKSIRDKKHITILGAGLIGCEFANDLSNQGYEVHVIDPAIAPLSLLIPAEVGQLLREALQKNGVHFHFDCIAKTLESVNHRYHLMLSNQVPLTTDLVISAIGLRPNLTLAKAAGLTLARGITVNRYFETSHADIYALGDCAEVEGHLLPYIAPILNGAKALAKTLRGEKTAVEYPAMPVIIKTPAHPIAVCPPPRNMQGQWTIEKAQNNTKALFYNHDNQLYGFVLTNDFVKDRMSLAAQLPRLL